MLYMSFNISYESLVHQDTGADPGKKLDRFARVGAPKHVPPQTFLDFRSLKLIF